MAINGNDHDLLPGHRGVCNESAAAELPRPKQMATDTPREEALDGMLIQMVMRHQDPQLRRILANPKQAEVLNFEIGHAVEKAKKWFP